MSKEGTAAVVALQGVWKAAFDSRRFDDLAALYAKDTAFCGSTRTLYETPAGVREYFRALPANVVRADFAGPHIVRLGEDALAATGEVTFYALDDGKLSERPYRMTHVLVREDGQWKIATHHASPRPPA